MYFPFPLFKNIWWSNKKWPVNKNKVEYVHRFAFSARRIKGTFGERTREIEKKKEREWESNKSYKVTKCYLR